MVEQSASPEMIPVSAIPDIESAHISNDLQAFAKRIEEMKGRIPRGIKISSFDTAIELVKRAAEEMINGRNQLHADVKRLLSGELARPQ